MQAFTFSMLRQVSTKSENQRRRLTNIKIALRHDSTNSGNVIPPVTERVLVVGPMTPATNLGHSGVEYLSRAAQASFTASIFNSYAK